MMFRANNCESHAVCSRDVEHDESPLLRYYVHTFYLLRAIHNCRLLPGLTALFFSYSLRLPAQFACETEMVEKDGVRGEPVRFTRVYRVIYGTTCRSVFYTFACIADTHR